MEPESGVDRPRVTGIKLSLFYPEYTGLGPNVIDENNGSFSAVVGSRVSMRVSTNRPVQTAELVFSDSFFQTIQFIGIIILNWKLIGLPRRTNRYILLCSYFGFRRNGVLCSLHFYVPRYR